MYNPAQSFDTYQPPPDFAGYYEPYESYESDEPAAPVRGGATGRVDTAVPAPVRGGNTGRVDTRVSEPGGEPEWGIARTTRLPEGEPLVAPATRMLVSDDTDLLASARQESEQVSSEVREMRLVLRQSQQELTKLNSKKAESAAQIEEMEAQLQMYPRDQIRDTYIASSEAEMRVFMMSEQVDAIKSKLAAFERYERFLRRTVELLEGMPPGAGAALPAANTPAPLAPAAPAPATPVVVATPEATVPAPEPPQPEPPQPEQRPQSAVRFDLHYGEGVPVEAPNYDLELVETRMLTPEPAAQAASRLTGSLEERQALQQAATVRVIQAEERVRGRVAQHLHERVLQPLVNMALGSEICVRVVDSDPPAAKAELGHLCDVLQSTLREATETMLELRPIYARGEGVVATIRRYATTLAEESGAAVEVAVPYGERELPPDVALAVFRVAQEALRNAVRHGQARHIEVVLSFVTDGLMVVIEDDGTGFDVDETLMRAANRETSGIMGMLERAEMLGGMLRVNSTPGEGTRVELGAPL